MFVIEYVSHFLHHCLISPFSDFSSLVKKVPALELVAKKAKVNFPKPDLIEINLTLEVKTWVTKQIRKQIDCRLESVAG